MKSGSYRFTDPNRLLTQFALERLLYRISRSPHSEGFILKGALLFLLWMEEPIATPETSTYWEPEIRPQSD